MSRCAARLPALRKAGLRTNPKRQWLAGVLVTAGALGVTACLSWWVPAWVESPPTGAAAPWVCALTESGSVRLMPLLVSLVFLLWLTDPGSARASCRREAVILLGIMAIALPGLAALNESVVKPAVRKPRPSHLRLAEAGAISDLDSFYRLDTRSRRDFLRSRLPAGSPAAARLGVHPSVLEHWIHEVGSTFPSGHALNAFIAAELTLGAALANPTRRRKWLAGALLIWAVAVSLSRVLLLMHRPIDVVAGALAGSACGAVLALFWWRWTQPKTRAGE